MIVLGTVIMGFCMGMMPQKVEGANLYVRTIHWRHSWEVGWVKECGSWWKKFRLWGISGGRTFWGISSGWHKGYAVMDCGGSDQRWVRLPYSWSWRSVNVYP